MRRHSARRELALTLPELLTAGGEPVHGTDLKKAKAVMFDGDSGPLPESCVAFLHPIVLIHTLRFRARRLRLDSALSFTQEMNHALVESAVT